MSSGYALHLEAYADLDAIRYYIAQENPDAADRVMSEIFDTLRSLADKRQHRHILIVAPQTAGGIGPKAPRYLPAAASASSTMRKKSAGLGAQTTQPLITTVGVPLIPSVSPSARDASTRPRDASASRQPASFARLRPASAPKSNNRPRTLAAVMAS